MERIAHSGRKSCTLQDELDECWVKASAAEGTPPEADMSALSRRAKCKVSLRKGLQCNSLSGDYPRKATVARVLSPNLCLGAKPLAGKYGTRNADIRLAAGWIGRGPRRGRVGLWCGMLQPLEWVPFCSWLCA